MKNEFLSKTGLTVYDEELKQYMEEQFGDSVDTKLLFEQYDTNLTWDSTETVYTKTYTYNGSEYTEILTEVSDTKYTKELKIDGVSVGVWTTIIDETNLKATTTFVAAS